MKIGIAGQARNGKDTLASLLCGQVSSLETVSFANELKNMVQSMFCLDRDTLEHYKCRDDLPPGMDVSMRRALQIIGDAMREVNSNFWVERLPMKNNIICTDIRYENELRILKEKGFMVILIARNVSNSGVPSETFLIPAINWFLANTSEHVVDVSRVDTPYGMFDVFIRNQEISLQQLRSIVASDLVPLLKSKIVFQCM